VLFFDKPLVATTLLLAAVMSSCDSQKQPVSSKPVGSPLKIAVPMGLPPLTIPSDNPPTADGVALGKRLFFDRRLSSDGSVSCATCHNPRFGFSDPRPVSRGVEGKRGTRNSPTILNAAFLPAQFWDGRAVSLEEQALGPISNPVEMDQTTDQLLAALRSDATYVAQFDKAFGPGGVTLERLKKAVASFERTLLSGNSPFDRRQFGGDKNAMSASAIRGLAIFTDAKRGNCSVCHTVGEKHALFSDGKFHNLGVGMNQQGELRDLGRYDQTKVDADRGAFKTPTLRNIAQTAPYMHDGSQKTLREVVDFYVGGGNSNAHLDKEIHELKLSQQDRADLVAFLEALTGGS
jgi:cytochrome c peroxidase